MDLALPTEELTVFCRRRKTHRPTQCLAKKAVRAETPDETPGRPNKKKVCKVMMLQEEKPRKVAKNEQINSEISRMGDGRGRVALEGTSGAMKLAWS